jgi:hypothetical protein
VAEKAAVEEQKARLREAAFVGYQVASAFGGSEGMPPFDRYLERLGLGADAQSVKMSLDRDRQKASETMQRAREAFARRRLKA